MGHPLNPHTMMSMSLEVDRINQIQFLYPGERQALICHMQQERKKLQQRRVNSKDNTENINRLKKEIHGDKKQKKMDKSKGSLIDVKI